MKQHEAVIEAMRKLGGYATLGRLYQETLKIPDVSWQTKTPTASIRRIVQQRNEFYKIKPGLWALKEYRHQINENDLLNSPKMESTHTDYQALLVEIGNWKKQQTFIPYQDKNHYSSLLQTTLGQLATISTFYNFSYREIVSRASTIDVSWFNERRMPASVFEVEHSTDMQNGLGKFVQLQDFNIHFCIVADETRKGLFEKTLGYHVFSPIQGRVKFLSYDAVLKWHGLTSEQYIIEHQIGF